MHSMIPKVMAFVSSLSSPTPFHPEKSKYQEAHYREVGTREFSTASRDVFMKFAELAFPNRKPSICFARAGLKDDQISYIQLEISIQSFFAKVLQELLEECGLDMCNFKIRDGIPLPDGVSTKQSDLSMVFCNNIPVGVVEVKRIVALEKDIHQLHHYMRCLRSFYGIEKVFGLLVDINSIRIAWLHDATDVATAEIEVPISPKPFGLKQDDHEHPKRERFQLPGLTITQHIEGKFHVNFDSQC